MSDKTGTKVHFKQTLLISIPAPEPGEQLIIQDRWRELNCFYLHVLYPKTGVHTDFALKAALEIGSNKYFLLDLPPGMGEDGYSDYTVVRLAGVNAFDIISENELSAILPACAEIVKLNREERAENILSILGAFRPWTQDGMKS